MPVVQLNNKISPGQHTFESDNKTFISTNPTHPRAVLLTEQQQVAKNGANCPHCFRCVSNNIKTYYSRGHFKMCDNCNKILEMNNIKIPMDYRKMFAHKGISIIETTEIYSCNKCGSDLCQQCYQKM